MCGRNLMQRAGDLVFIHKWVAAESGSSDPVTLLLLHGTGGDENALLPVGNALWPGAALLGLRGKILKPGLTGRAARVGSDTPRGPNASKDEFGLQKWVVMTSSRCTNSMVAV